MAATTDRRFTEFYRNSSVYESKQAAITGLYDHSMVNSLKDGEPVLARYMAYFKWDDTVKQYIHEETRSEDERNYSFTRLVSNETSATSTKEYIVNDIVNVTLTSGGTITKKSYICSSLPSGQGVVVVPVGENFATSGYFTEITSTTDRPQYVKTIRVIMGIATVFDSSDPGTFKKNPPQGKLTFFEEDDVIKELINNATIDSEDGTIIITNTASGKDVKVNIGSSLKKETTSGNNYGKIDVNIDNQSIKQYTSNDTIPTGAAQGELYVKTGSGLTLDTTDGIEINAGNALDFSNAGALDVQVDDNTISINSRNQIGVNFDSDTIERKGTSPNYTGWGVKHDKTLSETADGLSVNTGTTLTVDASDGIIDVKHDTTITKSASGIGVNIDDKTIKQKSHGDATDPDKLFVNTDNQTVELRSHDESGTTVYDGIGVMHDTTITVASHQENSTTVYDGLHVNVDNRTIKQYPSTSALRDMLHVNIDGTTLVEDATTGTISVNPAYTGVYGEKAIVVTNHETGGVVDGKTVTLDIDDTNNILIQGPHYVGISELPSGQTATARDSVPQNPDVRDPEYISVGTGSDVKYYRLDKNNGLQTHLTIRQLTAAEISSLSDSNIKEAYRLFGTANGSETGIGDVIKIYKDSSLETVYLGHVDDRLTNEDHETHESPDTAVTSGTGDDALCFIYQLADGNYKLTAVNVESYLQESEFKDGLSVNSSTHEVSVNLGNGLSFTGSTPGNRPIQARLGKGLEFDTTATDSQRPIQVRLGTGLAFDSNDSNSININLSGDTEININGSAITHTTHASFTGTTTGATISGSGATGTIKVPKLTVNSYGHITAAEEETFNITMPTTTISSEYGPVDYGNMAHLSDEYVSIVTDNEIVEDDTYEEAIEKLDTKIAGLTQEVEDNEAVWAQMIEDETRYYAKSVSAASTGAVATPKVATLVENRAYNLLNGTKAAVYFSTANTASGAIYLQIQGTESVHSDTKVMVYNDELFDGALIENGTTLEVVYDSANITINGTTYAGCYRVVGGVGSGNGNSGILKLTDGEGTNVVNGYVEVEIIDNATAYSLGWFKVPGSSPVEPIDPTDTSTYPAGTVFRVVSSGNYENKAYTWDTTNSKYVISDNITQSVNVDLSGYMLNEAKTQLVPVDNMLEIVDMSLNATVNASGTQYGANWLLDANGNVITPKTNQKYKVSNNYYIWNGTSYTSSDNTPDFKLTMTNTWDCGTF